MTPTPGAAVSARSPTSPGIRVGHHQRIGRGWQTGTTVVFVPDGATPGVDVRGGGPGTRETDALAPHNLVEQIHADLPHRRQRLRARRRRRGDGLARGTSARFHRRPAGIRPGQRRVPIVPAAVIFDLGRGGNFGHRPDAGFGRRAVANARRRPGPLGMRSAPAPGRRPAVCRAASAPPARPSSFPDPMVEPPHESRTVDVIVGALAVVNANGSPIDRRTGLPWESTRPRRDHRRSSAAGLLEVAATAARPPQPQHHDRCRRHVGRD